MDLIGLLIVLLILAAVVYGVIYVVNWMSLPEPFGPIVKIVVGIILILVILGVATGTGQHIMLPTFR